MPVLGVRSEDVTLWSFITSMTHSPLRSGTQREAMFYKRITRQRAPTGHPLPLCATCKDVKWAHRFHAFFWLQYVFGTYGKPLTVLYVH